MFFYNPNKNLSKRLDKTLINRGKPEEEVNEVNHTGTGKPMEHQPVLPNSKMINIEDTNFKLKVHYDQIDEKDLLMIEKYVNYIFHAYKEKYTLDVSANTILESYIYNNLEDYHNAYPWTGVKTVEHVQGLNQYMPHQESYFIGELLAHEIFLFLNYYNQQNHGIPRPSGHAGHDNASHFGCGI